MVLYLIALQCYSIYMLLIAYVAQLVEYSYSMQEIEIPKSLQSGALPNARQHEWVLRDDHINGCPESQYVWHAIEPTVLNG